MDGYHSTSKVVRPDSGNLCGPLAKGQIFSPLIHKEGRDTSLDWPEICQWKKHESGTWK